MLSNALGNASPLATTPDGHELIWISGGNNVASGVGRVGISANKRFVWVWGGTLGGGSSTVKV